MPVGMEKAGRGRPILWDMSDPTIQNACYKEKLIYQVTNLTGSNKDEASRNM
jgi:hypothetical protein